MGKIAAYYTIGGSGCIIILWLILLLYPGNWSFRNVGYAKVDVGLYWVRMRTSGKFTHWLSTTWNGMANCDSSLIEDSDEKSHISVSLLEFKECWCFFQSATESVTAVPGLASYILRVRGCDELGRMQFGSFSMFIFGWISIIFMVIGCGCMFHYWTGQARKKLRNFIRISLSVSAGSVTFGLFIFVVTSFDSLQHLDLFSGWGNESATRTSWGYSFYFGVFAMLLTWIPLLMTEKFGKAGIFEEVHEVMHAEKKERMWEEVNNIQEGFGNCGGGVQMQAMQSQPQQYMNESPPPGWGGGGFGYPPQSQQAGFGIGPPPSGPYGGGNPQPYYG